MSELMSAEEADRDREKIREGILESAKALGLATDEAVASAEARVPRRGSVFELSPDIAKKIALVNRGDGALEWRDAEPSRPLYVYRRDAGDVATKSAPP